MNLLCDKNYKARGFGIVRYITMYMIKRFMHLRQQRLQLFQNGIKEKSIYADIFLHSYYITDIELSLIHI